MVSRNAPFIQLPWSRPPPPVGMAPGAEDAVRRALGEDGIDRITQTISPGNLVSMESGGTHLVSGAVDGQPYALAFDLYIADPATAGDDVRRLRLQGIAAWQRGPGSPGGEAGNGPHIHCVWPGAKTMNGQNLEQISSFIHGYRGLSGRGISAAAWKDTSIQPDEIAAVRKVYGAVPAHRPVRALTPYEMRHRGRRIPPALS